MPDEKKQFLTSSELAEMLDMPVRTIQKLAKQGELPAVRIGSMYRYNRAKLYEMFEIAEKACKEAAEAEEKRDLWELDDAEKSLVRMYRDIPLDHKGVLLGIVEGAYTRLKAKEIVAAGITLEGDSRLAEQVCIEWEIRRDLEKRAEDEAQKQAHVQRAIDKAKQKDDEAARAWRDQEAAKNNG